MANEKRLIDANEAYEIASTSGFHNDFARSMADLTSLEEVLEDCTTVDAVEVVHAHWIEHKWAEEENGLLVSNFECSACHSWERNESNYCPNCGAKMDGGNEDG